VFFLWYALAAEIEIMAAVMEMPIGVVVPVVVVTVALLLECTGYDVPCIPSYVASASEDDYYYYY
jgi:hypothetical protein